MMHTLRAARRRAVSGPWARRNARSTDVASKDGPTYGLTVHTIDRAGFDNTRIEPARRNREEQDI